MDTIEKPSRVDNAEIMVGMQLDTKSQYLLVGNYRDGYLAFDDHFFSDYETLKEELPELLLDLKGYGTWEVTLYEVPGPVDYRIINEVIRIPEEGKRVFSITYTSPPIKAILFKPGKLIIIGELYINKPVQRDGNTVMEQTIQKEKIEIDLI